MCEEEFSQGYDSKTSESLKCMPKSKSLPYLHIPLTLSRHDISDLLHFQVTVASTGFVIINPRWIILTHNTTCLLLDLYNKTSKIIMAMNILP